MKKIDLMKSIKNLIFSFHKFNKILKNMKKISFKFYRIKLTFLNFNSNRFMNRDF